MNAFKALLITILLYIALTMQNVSDDISVQGEVVGKGEDNGKCYLAIEFEVTPEEFIGYDVGDEYDLR